SAATFFMFVNQGTVNASSSWACSNYVGQDVVGTNQLVFNQYSGGGTFNAGLGVTKTGNLFNVSVDNASIEISNNNLRVKSTIAGLGLSGGSGYPLSVTSIAHLTTLGTITS